MKIKINYHKKEAKELIPLKELMKKKKKLM